MQSQEQKTKSGRKTAASSKSGDETLSLVKAITALKRNQDGFTKGVENLQLVLKDYFQDLELEIQSKKRAREDLETDLTNQRKQQKIGLELELKEHGYQAAVSILKERNEMPVNVDEYKRLREEVARMQIELKNCFEEASKQEKEKYSKQLAIELTTKNLEHSAKQAEVVAALKQKDSEIQVLNRTIADLKSDLDKQRQLTEAVANAAASRPTFISPTNQQR